MFVIQEIDRGNLWKVYRVKMYFETGRLQSLPGMKSTIFRQGLILGEPGVKNYPSGGLPWD